MRRAGTVLTLCGLACFVRHIGDEPLRPTIMRTVPPSRGLQLGFEQNDGQFAANVRYVGHLGGLTTWLRDDGAILAAGSAKVRLDVIDGAFTNCVATSRLAMVSNYFVGRDPAAWRTNVPNDGVVTYRSVLPGVDLRFRATAGKLEYDFIVSKGVSPQSIQLRFDGADDVALTPDGDLRIGVGDSVLVQRRPRLIQTVAGRDQVVSGRYRLVSGATVAFDTGPFDRNEELLIDPVIEYSTYFGGSGADRGNGIAVDTSGNAYVTGYTGSTDLPTHAPYQAALGGGANDAFVAKINAAGTALVYATYLGGSSDDRATRVAVDGTGAAYVTGYTSSNNFPVVNATQGTYGGLADAFVTKLDPSGTSLVYSTYLGSTGDDRGWDVAVDGAGNAFVTGMGSTNFPTKNAFQSTYGGGGWDVFVAKLGTSGALSYSTFLGGNSQENAGAIAVDSQGSAYVTGSTHSTNFPTLNPFQATCSSTCGSVNDVFVTKLAASGSALVYSTYLGGTGDDDVSGIGVDADGNAYVTGETSSKDFPVQNALQAVNGGGGSDDFVTKLGAAGNTLVYSTYLGGNQSEFGGAVVVDPMGDAFVTGTTLSPNFPTQDATQSSQAGNYDAYLAVLPPSGSAFAFSTFIGGSAGDFGANVAIDNAGNAFVTGYTQSTTFPTHAAVQSAFGGVDDAFVTRISGLPNVYDAGVDASAPDAAGIDAASDAQVDATPDAGSTTPATSGCTCDLGSRERSHGAWAALVALLVAIRRRYRAVAVS